MAEDFKSQISEAMKKVVLMGVGTIFLTEETVRNYLSEMKLPKEMWTSFLENADKTKKEFLSTFAKEMAQTLSKVDFASEFEKLLKDQKVSLKIELSFDKKDDKGATKE